MSIRTTGKIFAFLPLLFLISCNFALPFSQTTETKLDQIGSMNGQTVSPTRKGQSISSGSTTTTPIPFTGSPPSEPPSTLNSWLLDTNEKEIGINGYALSGDDFTHNRFERPFNLDKKYRPDLDIFSASLGRDQQWLYVQIQLGGSDPATGTLHAAYGVEIDANLDGRGDILIWTNGPYSNVWSRENVSIYRSSTNMVGGPKPLLADAPWSGKTYDTLTFLGSRDSTLNYAWVRISPSDPAKIEIAIANEVTAPAVRFLWGTWADDGVKNPAKFDYNDFFSEVGAGSSIKNNPNYPPKEIWAVDNTCRAPYGFKASGSEPGVCILPPTPTPILPTATPKSVVR